jgi:hypothetical protein
MAGSVAAGGAAGAGFRPSFHLWMVLVMCFFIFGGFGLTYLGPLARGTFPPAPPVVHLHGVVFFGWMVLLTSQSLLVNVRNVRLHRSLGTFGIAYAGVLVFLGLLITIISADTTSWTDDSYGLFYLSLVAPVSFAAIFTLAIRAVKTPAIHRNLVLLATLGILMPGINRLYMMSFGLGSVPFYATYATMNVLLAAMLLHEHRVTGSVSRATWIGAAIIVVPQFLLPIVAPWQEFREFCQSLGSLVYYR